jgi:hypothetical protein
MFKLLSKPISINSLGTKRAMQVTGAAAPALQIAGACQSCISLRLFHCGYRYQTRPRRGLFHEIAETCKALILRDF